MFTFGDNKFWEKYFGVINLSNKELTYTELTVLGKGLKFCPTAIMVDHGKIKENLDKFFRSCSLRLFFSNGDASHPEGENEPTFTHKDMCLPSKFNPQMPNNLEHVYYLILDEILSYSPPNLKDLKLNLNNDQQKTLRNLLNSPEIIIKKADKGSNIVIQNRNDYIEECIR